MSDSEEIKKLKLKIEAWEDATTPSGRTKHLHIGEYSFELETMDEDGEPFSQKITVPWTTVKDIMKAIRADYEAVQERVHHEQESTPKEDESADTP